MRFPRAVSPPLYEPVVPTSRDTVYDSASSSDEESEARQAKRRKIEEIALRYKQGYPVTILSARLKGPFEGTYKKQNQGGAYESVPVQWQNPWTTRSKEYNETGSCEKLIPETAWKDRDAQQFTNPNGTKRGSSPVSRRTQHKYRAKVEEIEDWLRKDRRFATSDNEGSQRTPTPVPRVEQIRSPPAAKPQLSFRDAPGIDSQHPAPPLGASDTSKGWALSSEPGIQGTTSANQTIEDVHHEDFESAQEEHPAHQIEERKPSISKRPVNQIRGTADTRAAGSPIFPRVTRAKEARRMDFASPAIAVSSRISVVTKPETGPSKLTPKQQDSANVSIKQPEPEACASHSNPWPEQKSANGSRSTGTVTKSLLVQENPGLDEQGTSITGTFPVPSAQVIPQVVPRIHAQSTASIASIEDATTGRSSVNGGGEILEEGHVTFMDDSVLGLSTQAAVSRAQQMFRSGLGSRDDEEADDHGMASSQDNARSQERRSKDGITLFRAITTPSPTTRRSQFSIRKVENLDTQAMLDAMTPFALPSMKRKSKDPVAKQTPPTAVKANKKQKRASFAPPNHPSQESNSSSASIKSCLRVSKSTSMAEFQSKGMDEPINLDVTSTPHLDSNTKTSESQLPSLKELLRNTSPVQQLVSQYTQSHPKATGAIGPASAAPLSTMPSGTNNTHVTSTDTSSHMHEEAQIVPQNPITISTNIDFGLSVETDMGNNRSTLSSRRMVNKDPNHGGTGAIDKGKDNESECASEIEVGRGKANAGPTDFDLDAAIEDVGTFLQSFDPEKEAKAVAIQERQKKQLNQKSKSIDRDPRRAVDTYQV